MLGALTFIIVFGIPVIIHEFGHLHFVRKPGALIREFSIGMDPKILSHTGKEGTVYTIRILPLGGYVRMTDWGDDTTETKIGAPASLTPNQDGLVTRISLLQKQLDNTALPMNVTAYDLEDKLETTGLVLDETRTYSVGHDAAIVEENGTEIRIAPLDIQYQNTTVWGHLITNPTGLLNSFILGIIVFILFISMQGGAQGMSANVIQVTDGGITQAANVESGGHILPTENYDIPDWSDSTEAVTRATENISGSDTISVTVEISSGKVETLDITSKENNGSYYIGVSPELKTGLQNRAIGGSQVAWQNATAILTALKGLIPNFSLNKLGGPVAVYQASSRAASNELTLALYLSALSSMNLGVVNLIPIPALDDGKTLINLIKTVRRKPLKQETGTYVALVSIAITLVLMVAVTWNDIIRVFFQIYLITPK